MSRLNNSRNFFSTLLSLKVLVLVNVLVAQNLVAQQAYRYDVIATSSSSLQVFAAPSINNNGEVALPEGEILGAERCLLTTYQTILEIYFQPSVVPLF